MLCLKLLFSKLSNRIPKIGWLAPLLAVCLLSAPLRAQNSLPRAPRGPLPSVPPPMAPKPPRVPSNQGRAEPPPRPSDATEPAKEAPPSKREDAATAEVLPFGANLFMGNFLRAREDGLNPDYVVMPGDHVAVYTWGAVQLNEVLVVDAQGNIFLPEIGPVKVAGVPNKTLTEVVREGLRRVYAKYFDVYTNLITAKPVAVFVTGGVNRPGRYAGVPSDSILFFLDQAGGIDDDLGSYRKISILRGGKSVAEVDLYDFILSGKLDTPQFEDGDTILVQRRGPVVELRGDVASPALVEFEKQPILGSEALAIIPGAARATEVSVLGLRNGLPISHTLSLQAFTSFQLRHGDTVIIRNDGRPDTVVVKLEGEYRGPSQLAVRRGSRLVDVLNYIPVDPVLADTSAIHLKRPSVAASQKDSIDDSLFRLERSALLALSNSQGEADIRVKEAELTQRFVERARLIQPLGRVVTAFNGSQQNLILEEGDVIVIPSKSNVVTVGGEVFMAQASMFVPGLTAEDYIEQAGGYTDRSDDDRVIIHHRDASVTIGDPDTPVRPGDEVLVPPRIDTKVTQNILDVTQIIYQIAVSAAVVIAIL